MCPLRGCAWCVRARCLGAVCGPVSGVLTARRGVRCREGAHPLQYNAVPASSRRGRGTDGVVQSLRYVEATHVHASGVTSLYGRVHTHSRSMHTRAVRPVCTLLHAPCTRTRPCVPIASRSPHAHAPIAHTYEPIAVCVVSARTHSTRTPPYVLLPYGRRVACTCTRSTHRRAYSQCAEPERAQAVHAAVCAPPCARAVACNARRPVASCGFFVLCTCT